MDDQVGRHSLSDILENIVEELAMDDKLPNVFL